MDGEGTELFKDKKKKKKNYTGLKLMYCSPSFENLYISIFLPIVKLNFIIMSNSILYYINFTKRYF